jgi:uncharacterized iron-regulated membrane protein
LLEARFVIPGTRREQFVPSSNSSRKLEASLMRANTLQTFRQIHLYLGLFTAPAILFFAFTGILQTFSRHDASRDGAYQPPTWIVQLAQIHKKQTVQLPVRKIVATAHAQDSAKGETKMLKENSSKEDAQALPVHSALPLKIFFLIVGLGLFTSTISGLYMSWKYQRSKVLQVSLLLAGIVVPLVLMAV